MSGLGLYLHLPFCPARCPYCDFTAQRYNPGQARRLLAGLASHLEMILPQAGGRTLATVYFGGGTPSMLPARHLAELLAALGKSPGIRAGAEISMEANPGTLSLAKLKILRAAGFDRLSIGAQSFDPDMLKALGRLHGPDDTRRAVDRARSAGFANINLDLIHALPGQTPEMAAADVRAALELAPEHLSLYELTLSPDTPFGQRYAKGRSPLPQEDQAADMEDKALELIEAAGIKRYEVSNFARPGYECRHNQSTWRGGDYLALGPGAHGHLAGVRWAFVGEVDGYCAALEQGRQPYLFREELTPEQRALELIMLGLRTSEGVDLKTLARLLSRNPLRHYAGAIGQLESQGWARLAEERLIPTALGLRMADAAAALFV